MKLKSIPIIEQALDVSASDCETYYRRRTFQTPDRQKHSLVIPGRTTIRSFEAGIINDKGDVSCKGQSVKEANGQIVDRSVEMSQYTLTIKPESYELRGSQIDVISSHLQLPRTCKLNSAFCATSDTSFLWTIPRSRCSLEKVQDVSFTQESGYLIDHSHKILLKASEPQPAPARCPITTILGTEYPDLYLTKDDKARFHDLGNDLEVDTYSRALADYAMFVAEEKIAMATSVTESAICRQNYRGDDKIHPVSKDGLFASKKGKVIYMFKCNEKIAEIASKSDCYADIPLKAGGFVDIDTKIFKRDSPMMSCSEYHPLVIKAQESWIRINPVPKSIQPPEQKSVKDYVIHHEDLGSHGGIYTESELKSWRQHLALLGYSKAMMQKVSYGICLNEGSCEAPSGSVNSKGYNLGNLEQKLEDRFNFLDKFKKILVDNAAYVSAAVLCIEGLRVIIAICTITASMSKMGIRGLRIILLSIFCTSYLKYCKLQEAHLQTVKASKRRDESSTRVSLGENIELVGQL